MSNNIFDQIDAAMTARTTLIENFKANLATAETDKAEAIAAADAAMESGDAAAYIEAKEAERAAADKISFFTAQITAAEEKILFQDDEKVEKIGAVHAAVNAANAPRFEQLNEALAGALEIANEIKAEARKGAEAVDNVQGAYKNNYRYGFGVDSNTITADRIISAIKIAMGEN